MKLVAQLEEGAVPLPEDPRREEPVRRIEMTRWRWYEVVILVVWYAILGAWLYFFFSLA